MSTQRDSIRDFLPVVASGAGSPAVFPIIDTQGYNALALVVILASAGATTITAEEGDASNLSDAAAVASDHIETDDYGTGSKVHKASVITNKRYVRFSYTGVGTAVALLRNPAQGPA